jgi:hypothetical protein
LLRAACYFALGGTGALVACGVDAPPRQSSEESGKVASADTTQPPIAASKDAYNRVVGQVGATDPSYWCAVAEVQLIGN